jgi:hypothetical protein
LLRTGLRVGEFTALAADAVVLIGAGHRLHVPVGKLHDQRYLPLHPHLVTLIGDYGAANVAPDYPLLLLPRRTAGAGPAHRHPPDQQSDDHEQGGRPGSARVFCRRMPSRPARCCYPTEAAGGRRYHMRY